MNIADVLKNDQVDFTGIPSSYFLLGLLTAFDNRFQARADRTMEIVSWKQYFALICIDLCKEPPTLRELAEIMGSSHQNVKQILLKLQDKGFVDLQTDGKDRRKQRVLMTEECRAFCRKNQQITGILMEKMFAEIPEENLQTTIRTILKIEDNLGKLEDPK